VSGVRIVQNRDAYYDKIQDFVMLQKVVYEVTRPLKCYERTKNPDYEFLTTGNSVTLEFRDEIMDC
jgi:hypothetical protein